MLLNSLPNAFHYLHDAKIAKTTNLAEGYFSFMKTRYRDHRGLSPLKRKAFFDWFFYLKSKKQHTFFAITPISKRSEKSLRFLTP